jgi:hypothetical protein
MDIRILDLDGSLTEQTELSAGYRPPVHNLRYWGPQLRLACRFGRFRAFE